MKLKSGSISVRYHRERNGQYVNWVVYWYEDGRRQRSKHATAAAAERDAKDILARLASGHVRQVTADEVAKWQGIQDTCGRLGIDPQAAIAEYASLRQKVPSVPIGDLADCWIRHHAGIAPKLPQDILSEMIEEKRLAGLSEVHLRDLALRCGIFASAFQKPIGNISGAELSAWFAKRKWQGRSRNNYRGAVATLASFAKSKKYLAADWDALEAVHPAKARHGRIQIWTPAEMRLLLEHANPRHIPFLAIAAFSAIRTAEILRLDWARVGSEHITLDDDVTKLRARRLVPIAANLAAWLAPHRRPAGPVYPVQAKGAAHAVIRLARRAGLEWRRNALRHSGISYRVAQTNDVDKIAIESGNSPQMIFAHYRALVTPTQAEEWFQILPPNCPSA